jgi:dTDP-4-dehydrorhamnose 3,5-epimerase-like enzyme
MKKETRSIVIKLVNLEIKGDYRGSLISLESQKNIPFEIKRVYYIFGTQPDVSRGFHAHKNLQQLAICVSGQCTFLLDDGTSRKTITLKKPHEGLLIGNLVWREMHDFSQDCVLMVLASDYYDEDEDDYIRDYTSFKEISTKNVHTSTI